jgi:hypothetical protein
MRLRESLAALGIDDLEGLQSMRTLAKSATDAGRVSPPNKDSAICYSIESWNSDKTVRGSGYS